SADGARAMHRFLPVLALAALSLTAAADDPPAAPVDIAAAPKDTQVQRAHAEVPAFAASEEMLLRTSGRLEQGEDWRPGLLGHRYVQGRYLHVKIDTDSGIEDLFDDSVQGFDAMLNLPLSRVLEETRLLGIDLVVRHEYAALSSDTYLP